MSDDKNFVSRESLLGYKLQRSNVILKHISSVLIALVIAAILGGFSWVREVDKKVALLEDDLGEVIEALSRAQGDAASPAPTVRRSKSSCDAQCRKERKKRRRKQLRDIKAQNSQGR